MVTGLAWRLQGRRLSRDRLGACKAIKLARDRLGDSRVQGLSRDNINVITLKLNLIKKNVD